jgi:mannose-1-phosphate guanylyltransferase
MKNNCYAVIMAGGIGSRFWPVSTSRFPKQFHDMLGTGQSLLQRTYSRLKQGMPEKNIWVLTNAVYSDLVLEQLPIDKSQIVPEPVMRNTAPCILLSALKIFKENPDALILVAPSDHWIEDEAAFHTDLKRCFEACREDDRLVTLGINPTFPNTGYGYIESDTSDPSDLTKVNQFTEKPDYETAKGFLSEGNFLWNAGIFIWSAKSIIKAFENYLPEMYHLFAKGISSYNTSKEEAFVNTVYAAAENISIDYGVLEKADNVYVKKASFDWNDLGTWGALQEKLPKDKDGNAVVRSITHLNDAAGNMIYSSAEKLVVIEGINDYIIVDKEDVLLIYPKTKEQDIKKLLNQVSSKFGEKYT